jgi:hypothetical protein
LNAPSALGAPDAIWIGGRVGPIQKVIMTITFALFVALTVFAMTTIAAARGTI